jgi:hypothetical protein
MFFITETKVIKFFGPRVAIGRAQPDTQNLILLSQYITYVLTYKLLKSLPGLWQLCHV